MFTTFILPPINNCGKSVALIYVEAKLKRENIAVKNYALTTKVTTKK